MAGPEDLSDQIRYMGPGHIIDRDISRPFLRQRAGKGVHRLLCMAVDRTVEDYHCLLLRLIPAPFVILVDEPAKICPPDGTVKGADHLDVQTGRLLKEPLHLHSVFPHDIGIISSGVRQVLSLEIHLVIENGAVQRAKGSERIGGEEDLLLLIIGHQDFRPVHHRRRHEMEGMASGRKGIPLLHLLGAAGKIQIEELADHLQGLGACHHLDLRILFQKKLDIGRMVRLHVMDHQIINGAALKPCFQILKELFRGGSVHRVHQCYLLIQDEIGVIGYALRYRE